MTRLRQVALVVIAASTGVVGLWATAAPEVVLRGLPRHGPVWVAVDGPYNEHLVRDVGSLNLALAFVAVLALITGSTLLARAAGGAALIYGVPHLLYHATHLDPYESGDKVALIFSLSVAVLAGVLALAPPTTTDPATE